MEILKQHKVKRCKDRMKCVQSNNENNHWCTINDFIFQSAHFFFIFYLFYLIIHYFCLFFFFFFFFSFLSKIIYKCLLMRLLYIICTRYIIFANTLCSYMFTTNSKNKCLVNTPLDLIYIPTNYYQIIPNTAWPVLNKSISQLGQLSK